MFAKINKAVESFCKQYGVEMTSERLDQASVVPVLSAEIVKELTAKPAPPKPKKKESKDVEKGVTKKEDRPVMSAAR